VGDTNYLVTLRYEMDDRATRGANRLDSSLRRAQRSGSSLASTLRSVAMSMGAFFGLRAAGKALIGFNSNMEQARIQMAGMIQLTSGGDWTGNIAKANKLVGELQIKARESVGTTEDMVKMAGAITRPILAAGLGMDDLRDMTAQAVVAARSFGDAAEVAARDIDQALRGQFHATDPFMSKLMGARGYIGEEGRKRFNEMTARQRAMEVRAALAHPAIAAMAKAQGQSFEGVLSTLQDRIQMLLGRVGLPLFKAISAEIQKWNEWLERNSETVERWATQIASGLVEAFKTLKDVVAWVIQHKTEVMAIGAAWLMGRQGEGIGAAGGRAAVGYAGMAALGGDSTARIFGAVVGGLTALPGPLGTLATATAATAFGLQLLARKQEERIDDEIRLKTKMGAIRDWTAEAFDPKHGRWGRTEAQLLEEARKVAVREGMIGARGVNTKAVLENLLYKLPVGGTRSTGMGQIANRTPGQEILARGMTLGDAWRVRAGLIKGEDKKTSEALQIMAALVIANAPEEIRLRARLAEVLNNLSRNLSAFAGLYRAAAAVQGGVSAFGGGLMDVIRDPKKALDWAKDALSKNAVRPTVNVTIHRIEVQSDDPDRFVFGLTRAFDDIIRNPSGARLAWREG
jgi:hypothetical protein